MSARADVLQTPSLEQAPARTIVRPKVTDAQIADSWSPSAFAKEQIRGLVRQVFFSSGAHPVRQVVISSAGSEMDLAVICELVGRGLALEARASVAIVGNNLAAEKSAQA